MTKVAMYDVETSFSRYVAQAVSGTLVEVVSSGKPVVYIVGADYYNNMNMKREEQTGFGYAYDKWCKKFSSSKFSSSELGDENFPFDNIKRDDIGSRGMEWLSEN